MDAAAFAEQKEERSQKSVGQGKEYVGTIVGESTNREFRLAVAHEAIREQDIVAVDAELWQPDGSQACEDSSLGKGAAHQTH